MEHEKMQIKVLQNANLPINRLPVEILVIIITLAFPEYPGDYPYKPYPSVLFSSVCRYWRSVVLNHAMFWKAIFSGRKGDMTHPLIQDVLIRSRSVPLDVVISCSASQIHVLDPHAHRVKMLCLEGWADLPFSDIISSFPALERLFCDNRVEVDFPDETKIIPNLQVLGVYISIMENLTIPKHFPALWWLNVTYHHSIPFIPLLKALANLPSLRVLYLFQTWRCRSSEEITAAYANYTKPLIMFHQLEVLYTKTPVLQLITAPKLTYLDVIDYPVELYLEVFDHFCGFDFSKISHIRADFNFKIPLLYIMGKNDPDNTDDISTHLFTKYRNLTTHSILNEFPTSYPNAFHIGFRWLINTESPVIPTFPFTACLNKATNVVGLTLEEARPTTWCEKGTDSFADAMTRATSVRQLALFDCHVAFLHKLCLEEVTLFPHLERLTYFESSIQFEDYHVYDSTPDILDSLPKLGQRVVTSSRPLEIVLKSFPFIQPDVLEPFESLGLRIIQETPR